MSYARFSSDDWRSDVYVYESVGGGWVTHVAANRVVPCEPLPEPVEYTPENVEAWFRRHHAVTEIIGRSERVFIDLPYAGEDFRDDSPGECADRLVSLAAIGYHVPEGTIDALYAEAGGVSDE